MSDCKFYDTDPAAEVLTHRTVQEAIVWWLEHALPATRHGMLTVYGFREMARPALDAFDRDRILEMIVDWLWEDPWAEYLRARRIKVTKNLEHYLSLRYRIQLDEEADGSFVAHHPDLSGCIAQGDTATEAVENLSEARELWIKVRYEDQGYGSQSSAVGDRRRFFWI